MHARATARTHTHRDGGIYTPCLKEAIQVIKWSFISLLNVYSRDLDILQHHRQKALGRRCRCTTGNFCSQDPSAVSFSHSRPQRKPVDNDVWYPSNSVCVCVCWGRGSLVLEHLCPCASLWVIYKYLLVAKRKSVFLVFYQILLGIQRELARHSGSKFYTNSTEHTKFKVLFVKNPLSAAEN